MAVTYSTAMKTKRMQAVADDIDEGAGAGSLEIGTSGMATVLATFALAEPCGTVTGADLDFDFPVSDTSADATGTAAEAQIKDGGGVVVISGLTVSTVAAGTGDIQLDNTSIAEFQNVTLSTGKITHAT